MHGFILSEWRGLDLWVNFSSRALTLVLLSLRMSPSHGGMHRISERSSALAVFRKKTLSSYRIGSWQCSGAMDICSARVLRGSKHICSLRILRGSVHSLCAKDNIFISYFS